MILGIDFTSSPSRRKPITVARCTLDAQTVRVERVDALGDFSAFDALLREPGPWIGGFDLPFGLPRELVDHLGWPLTWAALMHTLAGLDRATLRETFRAFCAARPVGAKFAHRATDGPAGSSPSMKWVNPPVAYMLHAGAPRLLDAGVHLPGLHEGDRTRIALEAYPGYLARRITRASYKSDERTKQTPERRAARAEIVEALCARRAGLDLALVAAPALLAALIDDPMADRLDAVLCAMQAAHASRQPNFALPAVVDPIEGWIAGVPPYPSPAASPATSSSMRVSTTRSM